MAKRVHQAAQADRPILLFVKRDFGTQLLQRLSQDAELKEKIDICLDQKALEDLMGKILVLHKDWAQSVLKKLSGLRLAEGPPVLVLFDELSVADIRTVFDERYLNIKGFFHQKKLLSDLCELGRFVKVLKEELNLLSAEEKEHGSYQPLGTVIVHKEDCPAEVAETTSLFVDVKMRRFLYQLSRVLEKIRESGLWQIGKNFHSQYYAKQILPLFHEISTLLRGKGEHSTSKGKKPQGTGSIREQLSSNLINVLDALTKRPKGFEKLSPLHILIRGETGVGKTLIARWIARYLGMEKFPHINVPAIPETLLESELFGSLQGAYTDAVDRPGALLTEYGRIVFLDEIGDMPFSVQSKLLVYLDSYSFQPLGWPSELGAIIAPCYIVAATNQPLEEKIKKGQFRADLYHRFLYKLWVPPLRERKADLAMLVDLVLQDKRVNPGLRIQGISYRALQALEDYPFRGNFRELEDLLGRAVGLAIQESETILLEKHVYRAVMEITGLWG